MMAGRPLSDLFNKERDIPSAARLNVHPPSPTVKVQPCSPQVLPGKSVAGGLVGPDDPSWRS